ncbi:MAG TPA: FkbM family methyltransferase, partial [Longimicrobium sp.]|nr:FkbM family methyltransferase [Longimicrobium sp.]
PYGAGLWPAFRFFRSAYHRERVAERRLRVHLRALRMDMRPQDASAFDEVVLGREYDFLRELFADGEAPSTVLDLGANVGFFAAHLLDQWPDATVESVEAAPDTHALLEANRLANPGFRWRTHHLAVWSRDGEVTFPGAGTSTGRRVAPGPGAAGPVVPALTLDALVARVVPAAAPISILKVDVEGAEEAVLCATTVLPRVERLVVELHPALCDADRVLATIRGEFPWLHRVPGRASSKPLLVATRRRCALPEHPAPPAEARRR